MYLPRGFHVTTGEEEAGKERVGRGWDRISECGGEGPPGCGQPLQAWTAPTQAGGPTAAEPRLGALCRELALLQGCPE